MLKINKHENKLVIQELVHTIWGKRPSLKDISIPSDGKVKLYGKNLLYWGSFYYCRYDHPKQQPLVNYHFLSAVEEILQIEYHDNRHKSRFSKHMTNL